MVKLILISNLKTYCFQTIYNTCSKVTIKLMIKSKDLLITKCPKSADTTTLCKFF